MHILLLASDPLIVDPAGWEQLLIIVGGGGRELLTSKWARPVSCRQQNVRALIWVVAYNTLWYDPWGYTPTSTTHSQNYVGKMSVFASGIHDLYAYHNETNLHYYRIGSIGLVKQRV